MSRLPDTQESVSRATEPSTRTPFLKLAQVVTLYYRSSGYENVFTPQLFLKRRAELCTVTNVRKWEFTSTDGRSITVREAFPEDAQNMHTGFSDVVREGKWLPTYRPNGTISDWVSWIHRAKRSREILLVGEVDMRYAGHLSIQPEEWDASRHVGRLGVIVVQPLRGIGVGRALLQVAEMVAAEKGYEKIVLSTFSNNCIARHLYESVGYRMVGVREKHFVMGGNYIDEILYEKLLEPF